jgi:hypothetical protein
MDYRTRFTESLSIEATVLPPAAYFLSLNRKYAKNQPKATAFGNQGAHVTGVVCLWSARSVVFYSLGLSPPGFAENVRMQ